MTKTLFRWLGRAALLCLGLFSVALWLVFFSERPANTTDPKTLAGDGSSINYCDLPVLNNRGKRATDIPKGNTPGCSYSHFPLPVLTECTEPLIDGAADIRGLWRGISGNVDHVERVEQCGARTVITSNGLIHDGGPNASGSLTSNDTEGRVIFSIGNKGYCPRTSASMEWDKGVLNFHLLGWGPVVVRRYMDGEHLIWEYADGSVTRMERLCTLPPEHRVPEDRGIGWVQF